tara:strand:+ start:1129 stop:1737 length:609 start_codon:yes stop_codon:yes gene_type:complete
MKMEWEEIEGNEVHSTAIVNWEQISIGTGNKIGPYVCIGTDAQHTREESSGTITIGNDNIFREYTTVNLPTRYTRMTRIGNGCYFMALSHIAHDCVVEDEVIFSNNVTLGGHCHIMRGSQFGFNTIVHQYQVVGSYCMLGMGTIIPAKVRIEPGNIYAGNPAKFLRINSIGLERRDVSFPQLKDEKIRYEELLIEMNRHYAK